ncbi:MAG TPA: hypothetical protein VLJ39_14215, partial [Tepidisphaeraceae bacterium]|nr:hypothetical protein [Tepidisphaeraceae bacterium]
MVAWRAGGNPDCRRSARVRIVFCGESYRIGPAEVAERRLQFGMGPVPPGDTPERGLDVLADLAADRPRRVARHDCVGASASSAATPSRK